MQVYSNGRMKALMRRLHIPNKAPKPVDKIAQELVLDRIEKGPFTRAVKRVERVLDLLVTAERLRAEIYSRAFSGEFPQDELASRYDFSKETMQYPDDLVGGCPFSDPVTRELNEKYRRCLTELAPNLERYHSQSHVFNSGYDRLYRSIVFPAKTADDAWEHRAVYWLLKFLDGPAYYANVPSGLSRFRRCAACSRWIFAVTDHQRFCGERCRKHYAAQSPEFKTKRRIYMKERYRPQQKELQRRSLENAKRKQRERKGAR